MSVRGGDKSSKRRSAWFGVATLIAVAASTLAATWSVSNSARALFLAQKDNTDPILAGGELDDLPAMMRGNVPSMMSDRYFEKAPRQKPPRMCEMSENYFDTVDMGRDQPAGYTQKNEYVRKYRPRRGFLNDREMRAAKVAWHYFEKFTQEDTGMANSVGNYPSTTLWDTASYMAGAVAAYELCIIEKPNFDRRITQLLTTIKGLELFRNGPFPGMDAHSQKPLSAFEQHH